MHVTFELATALTVIKLLGGPCDDRNRDLLSRRLRCQGHTVATADGGRSALEAVAKSQFDLVLLDLMMPDITDWKGLRLIQLTNILRS